MSRMKSDGRSTGAASAGVCVSVINFDQRLLTSAATLSGATDFHRKNACAVSDKAAAADNDTAHRQARFRFHPQGRVAHLLLDFKTARLLLRVLRNCLINVCRHSRTILSNTTGSDKFFTDHSLGANTFWSRQADNCRSMDHKRIE